MSETMRWAALAALTGAVALGAAMLVSTGDAVAAKGGGGGGTKCTGCPRPCVASSMSGIR